MSEQVKALLAAAAGPNGKGDEGWHAASSQRLFFQHPTEIDSAGMVELHTAGEAGAPTVRFEAWVSPQLAAELIALVTGEAQATSDRLRHEIETDVRARYLALLETREEAKAADEQREPTGFEKHDESRSAELERLTREQFEDDRKGKNSSDDEQEDDDQ